MLGNLKCITKEYDTARKSVSKIKYDLIISGIICLIVKYIWDLFHQHRKPCKYLILFHKSSFLNNKQDLGVPTKTLTCFHRDAEIALYYLYLAMICCCKL